MGRKNLASRLIMPLANLQGYMHFLEMSKPPGESVTRKNIEGHMAVLQERIIDILFDEFKIYRPRYEEHENY